MIERLHEMRAVADMPGSSMRVTSSELREIFSRIDAQAAEIERLRAALTDILSVIPGQHDGGGFVIEHHSLDGEYIGASSVDPYSVVYEIAGNAHNALGGGTA